MTDTKKTDNADSKEGNSGVEAPERPMPTFYRDPTSTKPVPDTDRRKVENT